MVDAHQCGIRIWYDEFLSVWKFHLKGETRERPRLQDARRDIDELSEEDRHAFSEPLFILVFDPSERIYGERAKVIDFEVSGQFIQVIVPEMSNRWVSPSPWCCFKDTEENRKLFARAKELRQQIEANEAELRSIVDRGKREGPIQRVGTRWDQESSWFSKLCGKFGL